MPATRPEARFSDTGPTGHRARMRTRLLDKGGAGLADYEILEMLLFLGIPRRDTKPLAKGMINRYGSLAGVLRADPSAITTDFGLDGTCLEVLALPRAAEARLALAEPREAPVLGDWTQLGMYLASIADDALTGQWRVLHLDNRNRLLADEAVPSKAADQPGGVARQVMARALALHATALIVLRVQPDPSPAQLREAAALSAELGRASTLLSLVLHDTMVGTGSSWVSLRQRGML